MLRPRSCSSAQQARPSSTSVSTSTRATTTSRRVARTPSSSSAPWTTIGSKPAFAQLLGDQLPLGRRAGGPRRRAWPARASTISSPTRDRAPRPPRRRRAVPVTRAAKPGHGRDGVRNETSGRWVTLNTNSPSGPEATATPVTPDRRPRWRLKLAMLATDTRPDTTTWVVRGSPSALASSGAREQVREAVGVGLLEPAGVDARVERGLGLGVERAVLGAVAPDDAARRRSPRRPRRPRPGRPSRRPTRRPRRPRRRPRARP